MLLAIFQADEFISCGGIRLDQLVDLSLKCGTVTVLRGLEDRKKEQCDNGNRQMGSINKSLVAYDVGQHTYDRDPDAKEEHCGLTGKSGAAGG